GHRARVELDALEDARDARVVARVRNRVAGHRRADVAGLGGEARAAGGELDAEVVVLADLVVRDRDRGVGPCGAAGRVQLDAVTLDRARVGGAGSADDVVVHGAG